MATRREWLTVNFEALGRTTDRVKDYSLDSDYLTSTDGFSFTLYDKPDNVKRLEAQPVELCISGQRVDAAQQALGRIDVTDSGEALGVVSCKGRDYLADAVECQIDPELKLSKNMTLTDAFTLALGPVGIRRLLADGDAPIRNIRTGKPIKGAAPADFKKIKLDELKPQPGLGAWEWCNRLAARNGVTIQPSNKRNECYLSQPDYKQKAQYELRRTSDQRKGVANNIQKANAVRDYSAFATHVLFKCKGADSTKKAGTLRYEFDALDVAKELGNEELLEIIRRAALVGRRKPATAGEIERGKLYRLLYQQDEDATNRDQLECVAVRAFSELFRATLVYTATLLGHEEPGSGSLWTVNTVVDVKDEIANVYEPLWIASRRFYNDGNSPMTDITCWRLGAFQI